MSDAIKLAKEALRRHGCHDASCEATKVLGRMGSRSGLRWSSGDEKTCSCGLGTALAALGEVAPRDHYAQVAALASALPHDPAADASVDALMARQPSTPSRPLRRAPAPEAPSGPAAPSALTADEIRKLVLDAAEPQVMRRVATARADALREAAERWKKQAARADVSADVRDALNFAADDLRALAEGKAAAEPNLHECSECGAMLSPRAGWCIACERKRVARPSGETPEPTPPGPRWKPCDEPGCTEMHLAPGPQGEAPRPPRGGK